MKVFKCQDYFRQVETETHNDKGYIKFVCLYTSNKPWATLLVSHRIHDIIDVIADLAESSRNTPSLSSKANNSPPESFNNINY